MADIILHHNGVYNVYSTISDRPRYARGLTREELEKEVEKQSGFSGLSNLSERLDRANETGSSAFGETLQTTICCNRAGAEETELPVGEFINRFLTR